MSNFVMAQQYIIDSYYSKLWKRRRAV